MTNGTKTGQTYILKQDFEKIFQEYPIAKMQAQPLKEPIIHFFRIEFKNDVENLINPLSYNRIWTSTGISRIANWPSLNIDFEEIEKLNLKFAYIFKEDMSGVYLSIICSDKSDLRKHIKEKCYNYRNQLKKKFPSEKFHETVDLGSKTYVNNFLVDSIVTSKFYAADNIPSDKELLKDLKVFLDYATFLCDEERLDKIDNINKMLKTLEYQIKASEDIKYFDNVILHGSNICEMMIRLYLEKEGYIRNDNKYTSFGEMTKICYDRKLLPKDCIDYLNIIRLYRNQRAHQPKIDIENTKIYLKNLNYFLIWFNEFYSQRYYVKNPFKINEVSSLIQPFIDDEENIKQIHLNQLDEEKKELENESIELNEKIESLINGLDESIDGLIEEMDSLENKLTETSLNIKLVEDSKQDLLLEGIADGIKVLLKKTEIIDETTQRTEEKVDLLLNYLTDVRTILQKVTERQLRHTKSLEKIERILEDFTND